MKTSKRILAILLGVIAIVSMMAVSVAAGNFQNQNFEFTISYSSKYTDPEYKADTSPCYARVDQVTYSSKYILVSACGCTNGGGNKTNLTVNGDGVSVSQVTLYLNDERLIRSDINEAGFSYATLGFFSPAGSNWIKGVWSPDSIGSYPYAY